MMTPQTIFQHKRCRHVPCTSEEKFCTMYARSRVFSAILWSPMAVFPHMMGVFCLSAVCVFGMHKKRAQCIFCSFLL